MGRNHPAASVKRAGIIALILASQTALPATSMSMLMGQDPDSFGPAPLSEVSPQVLGEFESDRVGPVPTGGSDLRIGRSEPCPYPQV